MALGYTCASNMPRVPVIPALVSAMLAAALLSGCAAPAEPAALAAEQAAPTAAASLPPNEDEQGPGTAEQAAPAPTGPTVPPYPIVVPPTLPPEVEPAPEPTPEVQSGPFAMHLYRKGDFVPQYTFEWCVGASLQMMRNLTDAKVTRSRGTQQDYWEMARDLSHSPFGGANPRGWTAALNDLGYGPYKLVSVPKYKQALRVAASAMRETGRPVGLVMWRGRHAWVMSGFTADADPRSGDFDVTGVRVLDPLYPHGNSLWGASPKPNALLSPAKLGKQFVFRERRRVNLGVPPGYLLILPTTDQAA
jgi:hypothetical protein